MSNFEFAVPTLFGLEGIAGDELRRLDIENVRVENGRVLFSGDERAMAKANICLRTGERVLIQLADFKVQFDSGNKGQAIIIVARNRIGFLMIAVSKNIVFFSSIHLQQLIRSKFAVGNSCMHMQSSLEYR